MTGLRGSTPCSTYRLQISPTFTLHHAAALVDYLRELGVSHLYSSPLLSATPGSAHGYDTVDFGSVDAGRGGPEGFAVLDAALRDHGLGLVVDIVPNHMGVGAPEENEWWWDVLRHGRESRYAAAFDIDWDAAGQRLRIPVLADSPLALDDFTLQQGELRYYGHRYPLDPATEDEGGTPRQVHDRQHYELVSWRRADTDLNYRRFFAVNDLAAVTAERPDTFDAAHELILQWVTSGAVEGLRIDHPDGWPIRADTWIASPPPRPTAGWSWRRSCRPARRCRRRGRWPGAPATTPSTRWAESSWTPRASKP